MRGALRRATVVALAGTAAIVAQFTAIGPAQAAAPTITIAATSSLVPVTGDVMVVYLGGAVLSTAKIHGTISGAKIAEVAKLYAQRFPYKAPAVPLGSITLKSATTAYSFTVSPTLATRYAVRLFASATAKAPFATSPAQNLYVLANTFVRGGHSCVDTRPVCHQTYQLFTLVPSSALGVEMGKFAYPYFGLNLGNGGIPPAPKWLTLNAGHARVTKGREISAGEYENTLTLAFFIGSHSFNFSWTVCTRDTVTRDGIGLPGRHSCGVSRIPGNILYLGSPTRG